jgi:hypothetical protein
MAVVRDPGSEKGKNEMKMAGPRSSRGVGTDLSAAVTMKKFESARF